MVEPIEKIKGFRYHLNINISFNVFNSYLSSTCMDKVNLRVSKIRPPFEIKYLKNKKKII